MVSTLHSRRFRAAVLVACACAVAPIARAQVYKWVDAQGRTHYGERPADAGGASATRVRIAVAPDLPVAASAPKPSTARSGHATAPRPAATPAAAPKPQKPRAHWNGRDEGTEASRCALARDVLSGAVRHRSGRPTDAYDREVAQNDVKASCGAR